MYDLAGCLQHRPRLCGYYSIKRVFFTMPETEPFFPGGVRAGFVDGRILLELTQSRPISRIRAHTPLSGGSSFESECSKDRL